jgi:phosphoenolpyruvate-protein kinase (PTS system EI component)
VSFFMHRVALHLERDMTPPVVSMSQWTTDERQVECWLGVCGEMVADGAFVGAPGLQRELALGIAHAVDRT